MRIAFDAASIKSSETKNRGIGNYMKSLIETCLQIDNADEFYLFNLVEKCDGTEFSGLAMVKEFFFYSGHSNAIISKPYLKEIVRSVLQRFLFENKIDVFVIGLPISRNIVPYEKEWFGSTVVVSIVYDIIPFLYQERYFQGDILKNGKWYLDALERLREYDLLCAISECTANDVIKHCKVDEGKITTIMAGVDPQYRVLELTNNERELILSQYGIKDKFFICTGGDDRRKNLKRLIYAYAMMSKDLINNCQLVIVCKLSESSYEEYNRILKELDLQGRIILTGFVSDYDLIKLYNLAFMEVFPSEYEGFGLPVLEAWACGTPVLTSNNSSLCEIAKDAAILVDPFSIEDIRRGLEYALTDADIDSLIEAGRKRICLFSWEKVASTLLDCSSRIVKTSKNVHIDQKKMKIAIFTPLPPIESGISDYSKKLIETISDYANVDVYIDDYDCDYMFASKEVRVFPHQLFPERANLYDHILFEVGGSAFHKYMIPYLTKYDCCIEIHDFNLEGMIWDQIFLRSNSYIENLGVDFGLVDAERYWSYYVAGRDLPRHVQPNGFVFTNACKVIVHNEYTLERLMKRGIYRDYLLIKLFSEEICFEYDRDEIKRRMGIDDKKVIGIFGIVARSKRVEEIIRAYNSLDLIDNAVLLIIGGFGSDRTYADNCKLLASGNPNIIFEGHVEEKRLISYMKCCDIAFNLRYPYNGESSACFTRLLGLGKAVVVNRIGSFDEVPDDVCFKIPTAGNINQTEEIENIREAIVYLLNDENRLEYEKRAYNYANKNLDINVITKKIISFLQKPTWKGISKETIEALRNNEIYRDNYQNNEIVSLAETIEYGLPSNSLHEVSGF